VLPELHRKRVEFDSESPSLPQAARAIVLHKPSPCLAERVRSVDDFERDVFVGGNERNVRLFSFPHALGVDAAAVKTIAGGVDTLSLRRREDVNASQRGQLRLMHLPVFWLIGELLVLDFHPSRSL